MPSIGWQQYIALANVAVGTAANPKSSNPIRAPRLMTPYCATSSTPRI